MHKVASSGLTSASLVLRQRRLGRVSSKTARRMWSSSAATLCQRRSVDSVQSRWRAYTLRRPPEHSVSDGNDGADSGLRPSGS